MTQPKNQEIEETTCKRQNTSCSMKLAWLVLGDELVGFATHLLR
jgi:hypothetical protein